MIPIDLVGGESVRAGRSRPGRVLHEAIENIDIGGPLDVAERPGRTSESLSRWWSILPTTAVGTRSGPQATRP